MPTVLLHREVLRWPQYCCVTSHKNYAKESFIFFEDILPYIRGHKIIVFMVIIPKTDINR